MYGNNRNGATYNTNSVGGMNGNNSNTYSSQTGQPQAQFKQSQLNSTGGISNFNNVTNSSTSPVPNNSSSQQPQQQQQQQQRRMHPIRPLTIKQLIEAQSVGEGVLVVDGREVTQATVVGCIVDYENGPNNAFGGGGGGNVNNGSGALTAKHFGYVLSDNTGSIVVRQWIEAESNAMPLPRMTHVRASGTVKVWKETPIITGTVIAIADSNELNYHALDAILTHLRLTKGDVAGDKLKNATDTPSFVNNAAAVGVQNVLPGGETKVLLTDLLVSVIKQFGQRDSGMSMDELAQHALRYNFNANDVRVAMRTLAAEGKVYQTHDNRFNV